MKQSTKYLLLIIAGVTIFLIGRGCKNPDPHPTPLINTDSLANIAYNKGYEIAKLEEIGKLKEDTVKSTVIRWKVLKAKVDTIHDTIVKQVVKIADDVINTQADYIEHLKFTNAKKDTLIDLWIDTHKADSVNKVALINAVDSLTKLNKKLRRQNVFWKAVSAIEAAVIAGQALRD